MSEEKPIVPREVLADFMNQGHLTYRDGMARASDYDRADAMIRDLAAEGLAITPARARPSPADLLALAYVEEYEGVTTLDTILMDWDMNEGRRLDFARWLIDTLSPPTDPNQARDGED